jgi:hypothetical protein
MNNQYLESYTSDSDEYQSYLHKVKGSIHTSIIILCVLLVGVSFLFYRIIISFPNDLIITICSILLAVFMFSLISSLFDLKLINSINQQPLNNSNQTEEILKKLLKKYHPESFVNRVVDFHQLIEQPITHSISNTMHKISDYECIQLAYQAYIRMKKNEMDINQLEL